MTARLREAILSTMKTTPVILAALVLICVAGLTSVIHAAGRSDAPPPAREGTVVYFEGDVTVDGAPAEIGCAFPEAALGRWGIGYETEGEP